MKIFLLHLLVKWNHMKPHELFCLVGAGTSLLTEGGNDQHFVPGKGSNRTVGTVQEITLLLREARPMDSQGSGCACVAIVQCLCHCLKFLLSLASSLEILLLHSPTDLDMKQVKTINSSGRNWLWDAPHRQFEEANGGLEALTQKWEDEKRREVGSCSGLWRRVSHVRTYCRGATWQCAFGEGVAGPETTGPSELWWVFLWK